MRVQVKLLAADKEGMEPQHVQLLNMSALRIAAHLRAFHATTQCADHPDVDAVVVVTVQADGSVELDKSGLCCDDLRERVLKDAIQ